MQTAFVRRCMVTCVLVQEKLMSANGIEVWP